LLAREDIDAVLIATGDRWHSPMAILAAQHGKDVYCEKPCSMSMEESWALRDAFKRYGRIYQAGCQRRNAGNLEFAIDLVRTGKLGKLKAVYANVGPWNNWPPNTTGRDTIDRFRRNWTTCWSTTSAGRLPSTTRHG
jgi:predicted dehydrogenase